MFVPHKNWVKKDSGDGVPIRVEASEDLWIDGGITDNYPIWVFDKLLKATHSATLGFYLVSEEEKREIEEGVIQGHVPVRREIRNILDYTKAVIETVVSSQQTSAHRQSRDIGRTVYIDHLGTNMMNFGLSLGEKNELVRSGWDCVVKRVGLGREVGKCPHVIVSREERERESREREGSEGGGVGGEVKKKKKFMGKLRGGKEKEDKKVEVKEVVEVGEGPPSPDLDAATDTSPKCVIM